MRRNINTAESLQKNRKLASRRKAPHHLGQVVACIIHLFLYIYCKQKYIKTYKVTSKKKSIFICLYLIYFYICFQLPIMGRVLFGISTNIINITSDNVNKENILFINYMHRYMDPKKTF